MIGAILGDVVGSIYEFDNIKTKEFELFDKECFFTDDSVMTIAIAEALMQYGNIDEDNIKEFKEGIHRYGCIDLKNIVGKFNEVFYDLIMLIPDIADQFLKNILHRNNTESSAVFVNNNGNMRFFLLKLF